MPRNIVIGQKVRRELVERARQFRREMTCEEKSLWGHLRGNRLGGFHFRRQQIVHGFIVDFYCHAAGLIVEVDGPIHSQQVERDKDRDHKLSALGLRIMRIKNEEIEQKLPSVLERIEMACREWT